jgi:hypothetical protein
MPPAHPALPVPPQNAEPEHLEDEPPYDEPPEKEPLKRNIPRILPFLNIICLWHSSVLLRPQYLLIIWVTWLSSVLIVVFRVIILFSLIE